MLQILEKENNLVAARTNGKLAEEDFARILPLLEQKIKEHDKVRLYFEMEEFKGWEPQAFWEDLKFDVRHINDFEKIAIVGEKKIEKIITDLMKPFTSSEVRFFHVDQKSQAKAWIRD